MPWLVWLSGLRTNLRTKRLPVRFPVRAHAWLQARSPVGGVQKAVDGWCFSPCLPPSLKISKIFLNILHHQYGHHLLSTTKATSIWSRGGSWDWQPGLPFGNTRTNIQELSNCQNTSKYPWGQCGMTMATCWTVESVPGLLTDCSGKQQVDLRSCEREQQIRSWSSKAQASRESVCWHYLLEWSQLLFTFS